MLPTVLLVEPQPIIRESLAEALRGRGYVVLDVADGDEAVETLAGCGVSVIVSALTLPGRDGVAVLEAVATDGAPPVPAVLLVDSHEVDLAKRATAFGVRDFVPRPKFTFTALYELLAKHAPPVVDAPVPDGAERAEDAEPASAPSTRVPAKEPATPIRSVPHPPSPTIDKTEVLKTLSPLVTRPQIDDIAQSAHHLRVQPAVAAHLKALALADDSTLDEKTRAVAFDPALALRALTLANTNLERHRAPAESLKQAVDRLGNQGLQQLIEPDDPDVFAGQDLEDTRCLSPAGFWEHGHAVGLIAAEVTRHRNGSVEDVQTAYTAGLLHDIGRLVYARRLPDAYAEALETAEALGLPIDRVEQQMMLDDHAQLMDKALRHLRFGPHLLNAIACHHLAPTQARSVAGKHMGEIATLVLADRLAVALLAGETRCDPLIGAEHFFAALKLDANKIENSLAAIRERLEQDRRSYFTVMGDEPEEPGPQRLAALLQHPARPLFIGADPLADVYAVFARTLSPPTEGAKPTFALVRMTNVRERDTLTGRLRGLEFEFGVSKLPLLIVSPKGNLMLDDGAMMSRPVEFLAEPAAPEKLVQTLNRLLQDVVTPAAA